MSSSAENKKKYDFSGKVVLITGSSTGIGAAAALQFVQNGAQVAITGHKQEDVELVCGKIRSITGQNPYSLVGSLTEEGFPERLVQGTLHHYGRLDVLVNNAGICAGGDSFLAPDLMKIYDRIMGLNVRSMFQMIQLCVPHLAQTKGNIVNTSSVAAMTSNGWAVYSSSKAAVNMATKCAALDLGTKGIRVNSVK